MAVIEQDVVFTTKDMDGNTVIQMPITRAENIENIMSVEQGGTGSETASGARSNLGLATAVTGASINGKNITLNMADGTNKTLTTQDSGSDMADYIIESYRNGTDWYRVWESGWIEQGGYSSAAVGNGGEVTLSFVKSFTVKPTVITQKGNRDATSVNSYGTSGWHNKQELAWNVTTTSFKTSFYTNNGYSGCTWYACGE